MILGTIQRQHAFKGSLFLRTSQKETHYFIQCASG